jgi:hypothetical protein
MDRPPLIWGERPRHAAMRPAIPDVPGPGTAWVFHLPGDRGRHDRCVLVPSGCPWSHASDRHEARPSVGDQPSIGRRSTRGISRFVLRWYPA